MFRKVICVDLDGILTVEAVGYGMDAFRNRKPNLENIRKVNKLWAEGHCIVVFTARDRVYKKVTEQWLDTHGVFTNDIIFNKPMYDVFICDKAYNSFEDLGDSL